jgi:hypothetical protein
MADRRRGGIGGQREEAAKRAGEGRVGARSGEEPERDWYQQKAQLIDEILARLEERLKKSDFKASVGDFIRLLELRKELEEERPREIVVRWVEPSETEDAPA